MTCQAPRRSARGIFSDGDHQGRVRLGVDHEDQVTLPVGSSMTETMEEGVGLGVDQEAHHFCQRDTP